MIKTSVIFQIKTVFIGLNPVKKLYNLPGPDCYLYFETIWPFEPVLAQKEFLN